VRLRLLIRLWILILIGTIRIIVMFPIVSIIFITDVLKRGASFDVIQQCYAFKVYLYAALYRH